MAYKVVITADAKNDLEQFINYLIFDRKNTQAARNVLNDFDATIESLSHVAKSLKICDNSLSYHSVCFCRSSLDNIPSNMASKDFRFFSSIASIFCLTLARSIVSSGV